MPVVRRKPSRPSKLWPSRRDTTVLRLDMGLVVYPISRAVRRRRQVVMGEEEAEEAVVVVVVEEVEEEVVVVAVVRPLIPTRTLLGLLHGFIMMWAPCRKS